MNYFTKELKVGLKTFCSIVSNSLKVKTLYCKTTCVFSKQTKVEIVYYFNLITVLSCKKFVIMFSKLPGKKCNSLKNVINENYLVLLSNISVSLT